MAPLNTLRFLLKHPLSQRNRLATVRRFLAWQMICRFAPGKIAVDFVNDARLLIAAGMTGATGNLYVGLHEFEEMGFLLHFLRAEDLFVDVGANIGTYTILASRCVGASCVAVEPTASTFGHLLDNIALNQTTDRVDARQLAVGSAVGTAHLTSAYDTMNHVMPDDSSNHTEDADVVRMMSLDAMLDGRIPRLIKIDVEGFELDVLHGAELTLQDRNCSAIIIETNQSGSRYGRTDLALHQNLQDHGFLRYSYSPLSRRLFRVTAYCRTTNSIYLRDPDWVQERVAAAPPFSVLGRQI